VIRGALADRVAARFRSRFLQGYVRSKLRTDPLYAAVAERLRGHELPLVDIGCGVGLMAFYLRESGYTAPIVGIDHDESKIREANRIAATCSGLDFRTGDARDAALSGSSALLLDLLHYFSDEEQAGLLSSAASAVPPGGFVIIRDAVRDGSLRYRLTYAAEVFARLTHWLRAERLNFPTREAIIEPFSKRDFTVEVLPLWGRTPFNNYLFVFRRSAGGTTNA
jgi:2-polyprenyl-3-methyl-5-hydroxy-6-metoxy-1,4-benzoquinol methylase